ncbi:MAG: sugar phosphate isomerase/epimerase [Anaerolineae bacterium]|nr:sugar phosphate isomerase/epimerase [Anaerolineae bacterium]
MPTYGAHAFVWIGDWTTESGNHAIAEAGRVGFDFIEIPLLKPDTFDAKSHRAALKAAGIGSTCSLVLPRDAHMPHQPEKAKRFLRAVFDQMEQIDCNYLGGCIGYSLGTLTGAPPTEQELQVIIDNLGELTEEAKRRGIMLALEACNRYETYLYNTLDSVKQTIRAIGTDNLKIHADTYHMNIEEEGFYTPLVQAADVLDYIHMSESHRGLVGTGTVIWDQVWRGLADGGFTGKLVLESFAAINPDLAAATCLWRPPNQGPEVLASEGLAFLKAGATQYRLN